MYKRGEEKSRLIVGVYVEDLLITGEDEQELERFCYVAARRRARKGRPGAFLPTAGQEGRDFLLNSSLIRLIHLLSLYRGLLDSQARLT